MKLDGTWIAAAAQRVAAAEDALTGNCVFTHKPKEALMNLPNNWLTVIKVAVASGAVTLECYGHLTANMTIILGMVVGALGLQNIVAQGVSANAEKKP